MFLVVVCIGLLKMHGFLYQFMLGILLAKYYSRLQAWFKSASIGSKIGVFGGGIAFYNYRYLLRVLPVSLQSARQGKLDLVYHGIGGGTHYPGRRWVNEINFERLLHTSALSFLGRISYSFYLLHFAVLLCFTPLCFQALNHWGVTGLYVTSLIGLGSTIGVTVIMSALSYKYIELPEHPPRAQGDRANLFIQAVIRWMYWTSF